MQTWNDFHLKCELGTGTWAWGDKQIWGYGKDYADSDVRKAFDASIASGINCFDTAEMYGFGRSEKLIGHFVAESKAPVVVLTKFMPLPWRVRKGDLLRALRHSLQRLDFPTVSLYQIHWPLRFRSIGTWMDALADAVDQGLTRGVGVSNYGADQLKRAHEHLTRRGVPLLSNQVEYSLLDRSPEWNGVKKACEELGIKLIAYSPLAMGVLTGKYTADHRLGGYRGLRFNRYLSRIQNLTGLLREVGQAHGNKSPSQVALNWTICKGTFPIPGAKNASQASENAGAQGWKLTTDEILSLEHAAGSLARN
ncbi:MAG TPA: aldo/keto reductase [Bacteroidota bacterium]|nr:aldo/keto reductase [Bacteroidota bacterium]